VKGLWVVLLGGIASLVFPDPELAGQDGGQTAQGFLVDAGVQITLPQSGSPIPVQLTYRLQAESGAAEIPLSLLTPDSTRVANIRMLVEDGDFSPSAPLQEPMERAAFTLIPVRDHFSEGSVEIPGRGSGSGGSLSLGISYTVECGWDDGGRVTLPLVVPRWIPEQPAPNTFTAVVEVPAGATVLGSFPTSVSSRPQPEEGGTLVIGLQAVPSILVLRTAFGDPPPLTTEGMLDLLVVLILLAMGGWGYRYLRGREG
jgi:hypothetical protein